MRSVDDVYRAGESYLDVTDMAWENLRGHEVQLAQFRRIVAREKFAHTYLFVGPAGIGKALFARQLAQCLFCERFADDQLDACGECPSCKQMLAGTHPDFHYVNRPKDKTVVPISAFIGDSKHPEEEGLCRKLSFMPSASDKKVAIIDDAELLSPDAANALLKTLEEPPPFAHVFLISTSLDAILPTIRSRSHMVRFQPLASPDVADLLMELELAEDRREAEIAADLSDGTLDVARRLLDPNLRELRETLYENLADESMDSNAASKAAWEGIDRVSEDTKSSREAAQWLVRFAVEFYRRVLGELTGGSTGAKIEQVSRAAARLRPATADTLEVIMELIERGMQTEAQIDQNVSVPLCLDAMFDDLGRMARQTAGR